MTRRAKPLDELTDDERRAAVLFMLKRVAKAAARARHGTWHRSATTDAICNAGPNWKPGRPFTDFVRNRKRINGGAL